MAQSATMTPEQQSEALSHIMTLASLFSTCVEAFGLVSPSNLADRAQRVAWAKLGIEQGRLLIFGDIVGISSPLACIATHMIPSRAGPTNPDPTEPIFFEPRDPRLDEPENKKIVEDTLNEIIHRPSDTGREQMMELYGLKSPKRYSSLGQQALDSYRLESFREKYGLLQDLYHSLSTARAPQRGMSMTMQRWAIHDVQRFEAFVRMVQHQVDKLQNLMDCKERIDRSMKTDIKTLAWHPEASGTIIRKDWDKLKLISEACHGTYPEYVQAAEAALEHLSQEARVNQKPTRPKSTTQPVAEKEETNGVTSPKRRPSLLSYFRFSSFGKRKNKDKGRSQSVPQVPMANDTARPQSAEVAAPEPAEEEDFLTRARSKSLPAATPEMAAALALFPDSNRPSINDEVARPVIDLEPDNGPLVPVNTIQTVQPDDGLTRADTRHSLIERHDQYHGLGRIETKEIRTIAHHMK